MGDRDLRRIDWVAVRGQAAAVCERCGAEFTRFDGPAWDLISLLESFTLNHGHCLLPVARAEQNVRAAVVKLEEEVERTRPLAMDQGLRLSAEVLLRTLREFEQARDAERAKKGTKP